MAMIGHFTAHPAIINHKDPIVKVRLKTPAEQLLSRKDTQRGFCVNN